jgi:hypothetical protein
MRSFAECLPALPFPGYAPPKTYAAWPVWSDSTTKEIKFEPLPKKIAARLYHRARDFDRKTNKAGCHGGAVGPAALKVLEGFLCSMVRKATLDLPESQRY